MWVDKERKEVKERKKAFEQESVMALKKVMEVDANQKHMQGLLTTE